MVLFNLIGIDLKFSTTNHPQMDGKIKRVNTLLVEYLRYYMIASQKN